jgi:glutathione S-transferase
VARAVVAEMHSGFSNLRQNMTMDLRARKPGQGRAPGVAEDIARIQALWNDCRARFGQGGPFLFGHFTIADAFYAPVVTRFVTYEVELDAVSGAYRDTILELPALKTWTEAARSEPPVKRYL